MAENFYLGDIEVGNFLQPYIIAEIGVNHEGDVGLAKRLIEEAAAAGANAAKFQTYKAGKLAIKNSPAYWDTEKEPTDSQYNLFKKFDSFEPDDYTELAEHCRKHGIHFLSTPFDLGAVEFLTPLVPAFKIASADITNVPLIRQCAAQGKPLILSTGASTLEEIAFAVDQAKRSGAVRVALLHCILNYPTRVEDAQLARITVLQRRFPECSVGYSDHVVPDLSMSSLELATLLGSTILEKHFTHDKSLPGNDHYHAMDNRDLDAFRNKLEIFCSLLGSESYNPEIEAGARMHARRSIVAARDIGKGEILTEENLIAKRPAHGISPVHWDDLVGRRILVTLEEDQLIRWDMVAGDSAK